ncbi:MAG: GTPase Era, partial [Solirubrobacterales bacterium]|nr:GTPase Era [Solirubrobacterales bacterium]
MSADAAPTTRAGFVALAGRPNVGKSTLVNAIVGHKVAIVSDKPQTTRRAIRGVATRGDAQLVLTDLPGVQKPLDALTSRMQRRVEQELEEADVALMVLNAEQGIGPGDRWIASVLASAKCPVVIALNKVDRLDRPRTVLALQAAAELGVGDDVFPVSARTGSGVAPLVEHLVSLLPESPFFFGEEERSDLSPYVHLAELIREQVLRRTFQEVPHAVEVVVDEVEDDRDDLAVVRAKAWVETES